MGAPWTAILLAGVIIAAGALWMTWTVPASASAGIPQILGLLATTLLGLAAGLALRAQPEPAMPAAPPLPAPTPASPPPPPPAAQAPADDRPLSRHATDSPPEPEAAAPQDTRLLSFAQDLVGATSGARVKKVIGQHLPPLLGTRRVWIASYLPGRQQVIVPDGEGATREPMLTRDGQEWTTFVLRVEGEPIGLLGVESVGGLRGDVRRVVELVTPILAQALKTAEAVDTLRETSLVDLLTGTATRREGLTRLRGEIKRAQRTGSAMAVLMLDLDRFKSINDRFGHATGDALLSAVGQTMTRTLRASDIRSRWGGEEFLIVLPETDLNRALIVAQGLLRNIAAATVATATGPVGSTASIGLTISRPGETEAEPIIRRADMALYRAKESGRGCVRVVLADRHGNPTMPAGGDGPGGAAPDTGAAAAAPETAPATPATLPFPDRRNPGRGDRRRVPSPGRRATDPKPVGGAAPAESTPEDRRARSNLR